MRLAREIADHGLSVRRWPIELLQRSLNVVFFYDFSKLAHQEGILVRLVVSMAIFARIVSIVDANLVFAEAWLQNLALVLLVKVDDEERMLESDKEVAFVCCLFWLLLVRNRFNGPVATLVLTIDLLLELLLGVAAGDVLDAQVGAQVLRLFHKLNLHGLVIAHASAPLGCRAGILGA